MKVTGLKLSFGDDGEVEVKKGKRILPHRVELIEQAFEEKRYEDVEKMLFNFSLRGCLHATNRDLLSRETKIFNKLITLLEKEEHV